MSGVRGFGEVEEEVPEQEKEVGQVEQPTFSVTTRFVGPQPPLSPSPPQQCRGPFGESSRGSCIGSRTVRRPRGTYDRRTYRLTYDNLLVTAGAPFPRTGTSSPPGDPGVVTSWKA